MVLRVVYTVPSSMCGPLRRGRGFLPGWFSKNLLVRRYRRKTAMFRDPTRSGGMLRRQFRIEPIRIQSRRSGQASARDSNRLRAGPGRAGPTRPGRASPPRELAPPAKIVGFEILDFLRLENITKRDVKRDTPKEVTKHDFVLFFVR